MAEAVAPVTQRRGRPDAGRRRLGWFLALAALLHVPLTPLAGIFGLLALLRPVSREAPPEVLSAIPVSLLSPEEMAALGLGTAAPPPEAPPPEPSPAEPGESAEPKPEQQKPKPKPKPKPVAETPDAGPTAASDAAAPVPKPPAPNPTPLAADAGAVPKPKPVAPAGPEDPSALVGKAGTVADPNANVRLLLLNDRIRGLAIAPRIGRLVSRLPQWNSFFGPTSLDPIRDIDRMYVAGPQFRSSAEVVAILQYSVSETTMHRAIDAIVQREPKGEWLDKAVPAARARADRADRVFVLPKKGHLLMMVPPHLTDDAVAKARGLGFPSVGGSAAVVAFLSKPWRALLGLGVPADVPRSIASASLSVTPADDGSAVLHIEAADESPEAAESDAALLTRAVNMLTQRDVGALGAFLFGGQTLSLIEPVALKAEGRMIRGDARITARQLDRLLGFAEAWVDAMNGGPPPPRPSSSPSPVRTFPRTAPAQSP